MHSHDRTLLARLGFADPDKREPMHDRACAYLAEDAQARRLVSMVDPCKTVPADDAWLLNPRYERCTVNEARANPLGCADVYDVARIGCVVASLERPLIKGAGQYSSTLGFLDIAIAFGIEGHDVGWRTTGGEWKHEPSDFKDDKFIPGRSHFVGGAREQRDRWVLVRESAIIVEVKIGRVPLGDALRQLNLYRGHGHVLVADSERACVSAELWRTPTAILATAYPITRDDVAVLAREKIRHVRLGDGFRAWCERPRQDDESPSL